MDDADDLSAEDREIVELVRKLRDTGDLHPLIALLRGADGGPTHARTALRVLADLDPDLLVQVALDHLIDENVTDPRLAEQMRRAIRGKKT